jgi:hypothetical protein
VTQERNIGLDSQCLTYLIVVASNAVAPTDALAEERTALLRTWLYADPTFWLAGPVSAEYQAIRDQLKRELHVSWSSVHLLSIKIQDPARVTARTADFLRLHPEENDCRILAEAEDCGLSAVLTFDTRFQNRLRSASRVILAKPSEYWQSLKIPKGAQLVTRPREDNPLGRETWWRW